MCIVVCKPSGIDMPNEATLHECFISNPDGAGYMFTENNEVVIKKGFMNEKQFLIELNKDYERLGKDTPFVLHFRIQTQGGVNQQCTHPFPLSKDMNDLKLLDCSTDIGIAHNGIISLTSKSSSYKTVYDSKTKTYKTMLITVDYSDTMKFITDYLSLIIDSDDWYLNEDKKELIEKLIGYNNKFAIMSKDGHIELIGNFVEDGGCYYSNTTYKNWASTYGYEEEHWACSLYTTGSDENCPKCPYFNDCYGVPN